MPERCSGAEYVDISMAIICPKHPGTAFRDTNPNNKGETQSMKNQPLTWLFKRGRQQRQKQIENAKSGTKLEEINSCFINYYSLPGKLWRVQGINDL